ARTATGESSRRPLRGSGDFQNPVPHARVKESRLLWSAVLVLDVVKHPAEIHLLAKKVVVGPFGTRGQGYACRKLATAEVRLVEVLALLDPPPKHLDELRDAVVRTRTLRQF